MRIGGLVIATALFAAAGNAASVGGSIPLPLPLFPGNNWWNLDISSAPVDPSSASYIAFIGSTRALHPDFGGDDSSNPGSVYGFPFIVVDAMQSKKSVAFEYSDESDGVDHSTDTSFAFYPIPDQAITSSGWIEAGPPGNVDLRGDSDRHILIVDSTNNHLYELYSVWFNGAGWEAGSGAFFDMGTNDRRPEGWTSADAAGLAILPGLVRYGEVAGDAEIGHAFRVTVRTTNGHVFPGSHTAGNTSGALPMGARLRLKAGKDISGFTPEVQKIFRAMKKYGLIVADNGSDMYISGTYDTRWNNDVLNPAFGSLEASDFEVVQLGWQPSNTLLVATPAETGSAEAFPLTVTAYDSSYSVATGYRGTVHFASSDGAASLPSDYAFSAADNGSHTFAGVVLRTTGSQTITVSDVSSPTVTSTRSVAVGPAAPSNVSATANTTAQVSVSWTPASGAVQYEVARSSAASPFATIATVSGSNYADGSVTAGMAYVYKVRAIDAAVRRSGYSAPDIATTIVFTDEPLAAGSTVIRAAHVTELRAAVNAVRGAAGLGAFSFSDGTVSGATIRATHIEELRSALATARSALGLSSVTWNDATLAVGVTPVKAIHLQQLRDATK